MSDHKTCSRCRQSKPLADFKSDVRKPDGKASSCKACVAVPRVGDLPLPASRALVLAFDAQDPKAWATRITNRWCDSVQAIIDVGRLLEEAKAALPHGEFGAMCATELPFTQRTAQMLMVIAQDERLSNPKFISLLPASWGSLYDLTRLSDGEFEKAVVSDKIRPAMARAEVQMLRRVEIADDQARILQEVQPAAIRAAAKQINAVENTAKRDNARRVADELSATSKPLVADRRYPVIYADPATRFESGFSGRSIENHYPTDSIEAWCKLPVRDLAWSSCILFCWTTVPHLANTINLLLPDWGFEYKSCLCWDKVVAGTGYWARNQHELLLIATRGSPSLPEPADVPASVHSERKGDHSAKPSYYHELIERMTPGQARIELFARGTREGWDSWGNQSQGREVA